MDARIEKVDVLGVSHRFGATWALRGVECSFEPGQLHLVLGANGSGKSTLLGVIGTLLRPTSGSVVHSPIEGIVRVRRQIGWASHEAMVYPDLSTRENLAITAKVYGVDPQTAWTRVVDQLAGLSTLEHVIVRVMSRGQKQRVCLARAIVPNPSLLLLDEPTTGLDADGVAALVKVLTSQVSAGNIVVVVTHDPGVFDSMPSKQIRLERGRLAA